jgi:magnesium chelatase subunit I
MNPEEGNLRPQILDRFGLRVIVKGLDDPSDRIEAYRRVSAFIKNPRQMIGQYKIETAQVSAEIQRARDILRKVEIPLDVEKRGTALIQNLKIDSLRAEITLFESARAYAAADGRYQVQEDDITNVATMCLRLRRSDFMDKYLSQMDQDDQFIKSYLDKSTPESH